MKLSEVPFCLWEVFKCFRPIKFFVIKSLLQKCLILTRTSLQMALLSSLIDVQIVVVSSSSILV